MGNTHNYNKKVQNHILKTNNLFNTEKYDEMFNLLDSHYLEYGTVDYYYDYYNTLPLIIILSKIRTENKIGLLTKLFNRYNFDLNKRVCNAGNIICNIVYATQDINIYKLLLDNGAKINTIDDSSIYPPITALDTAIEYNYVDLINFLRTNNGKTFNEIKMG